MIKHILQKRISVLDLIVQLMCIVVFSLAVKGYLDWFLAVGGATVITLVIFKLEKDWINKHFISSIALYCDYDNDEEARYSVKLDSKSIYDQKRLLTVLADCIKHQENKPSDD